jgi:hypothetical protein
MQQTLQPGEQMWVDIARLVREHIPDKNGKFLPADVTSGTYEIQDLTHAGMGQLFEGKVVYDKTYGNAAYGCGECCGISRNTIAFLLDPLDIPLQDVEQQFVQGYQPCSDSYIDVSDYFYDNWSTADRSIATVDEYGNHTGMGVGSTTSQTSGVLSTVENSLKCPNLGATPSGNDHVSPQVNSVDPDFWDVGTTIPSVTISGGGFGSSPTVNLPTGVTVTGGQGSTNTTIVLNGVIVSTAAQIGPSSITVTATGSDGTQQTSGPSSITLDGPFYLIVEADMLGKCTGCSTAVLRAVTYQVTWFSGLAGGITAVGENPVDSAWNCNQNYPGVSFAPCSQGFMTTSNGEFTDDWSIGSDGFTPTGCGSNTDDHWMWCATGNSIGHLSGYVHTNAVKINGVVNPPNQFSVGTIINP